MQGQGLRQRAIALRRNGWSYNVISQKLGMGKSTLSDWLREIPYEPNAAVQKRIGRGPAKAAASKQKARSFEIDRLRQEGIGDIGKISDRDLLFLGIGLYMGEGSKSHEYVRLVNSDPKIIRLSLHWFRTVCHVPDQNFSLALHLYPDISTREALSYWIRVTGLRREQFEKIQVVHRQNKTAKKRGHLPYGTAHLKVWGRGDRRFGVTLHRRIMGWIGAVHQKCGCSSMVECLPSKQITRVRFPSPAPFFSKLHA